MSVWVIVGVGVAVVALVAVVVFLLFPSDGEDSSSTSEATAGTTTTDSSSTTVPPTSSTSAVSTTTMPTTTTTSTLPPLSGSVEGVWSEVDTDGSLVRSEYVDGVVIVFDDGGSGCVDSGLGFVEIVGVGTYTERDEGDQVVIESIIDTYCFPKETGLTEVGTSLQFETVYDPTTDRIGNADRVVEDNPISGNWEGVDVDGSIYRLEVSAAGVFIAIDTSSSVCVNNGFPGDWGWRGFGTFDLSGPTRFTLQGTTVCLDTDDSEVVHNPMTPANWYYEYDANADELVFSPDGARLQRVDS